MVNLVWQHKIVRIENFSVNNRIGFAVVIFFFLNKRIVHIEIAGSFTPAIVKLFVIKKPSFFFFAINYVLSITKLQTLNLTKYLV